MRNDLLRPNQHRLRGMSIERGDDGIREFGERYHEGWLEARGGLRLSYITQRPRVSN